MTSDICALVGELHIVYQYDEICTVTMDQDGVLVEYKVLKICQLYIFGLIIL